MRLFLSKLFSPLDVPIHKLSCTILKNIIDGIAGYIGKMLKGIAARQVQVKPSATVPIQRFPSLSL
jgi:hypothetical protein